MQSYIVRYYTVPSYQLEKAVSVVHWDGQRWVGSYQQAVFWAMGG